MRHRAYLGEIELLILLTIIRLGDDAYGVPLTKGVSALRGGHVFNGVVYAALHRLKLKGLVASTLGTPSPERGGRAKRYFRVTESGLEAVNQTYQVLTKLWKTTCGNVK